MSAVSILVEKMIADNVVVVFSKSYCPYCKKAKNLLAELTTYKALELDQTPEGDAIQAYLAQKTGQRTVPNIFINQAFVGISPQLTITPRW